MNVVQFRELAMVALPGGVLRGFRLAFQNHETPLLCSELKSDHDNKEKNMHRLIVRHHLLFLSPEEAVARASVFEYVNNMR